jgi:transforming growth factor-beta-induced protein
MKKLKNISLLLFAVFALYSCTEEDTETPKENPQTLNIVETAQATADLSSLVAAVIEADLAATLSGPGPFTVLAPTNEAFATFLSENGWADVTEIPDEALEQVLLNHVISGNVASTDLTSAGSGYTNTLATGSGNNSMSIYYNTDEGVKFNNVASVLTADVSASNGTVHIVDKVIGLPTVVTFATADPNFSILVSALTRESSYTYVETLSTADGTDPAPFTVFAPTNDAFVSLLEELDLASLGDVPTETLTSTLNTHVVAKANVQSTGLSDGMIIKTLGGTLTANVTGEATLTDSKDRVSNIIAVDVQASNGVIHAIDKVVLE